VTDPDGGEAWISSELAQLSAEAIPSAADVALVQRVVSAFSVARATRMRILDRRGYRNTFR